MIPQDAWRVEKMRLKERDMGWFIQYNQHLDIGPIPQEALRYTICNRTPLKWIIDRYQVKRDKDSGFTNDPNDWIAEQIDQYGKPRPDALAALIKRVILLSIETARIIKTLPHAVDNE